jgi:hypothetical protein
MRQVSIAGIWRRRSSLIAAFSAAAILAHLILRFALHKGPGTFQIPLVATLAIGGTPLVYELSGDS